MYPLLFPFLDLKIPWFSRFRRQRQANKKAPNKSNPTTPAVEAPTLESPTVETPTVEAPKIEAPTFEALTVEAPIFETPRVASPVCGKLRYVAADHTPVPSPKPYGIPFISEFQDERVMPLHDLRPLSTLDQLPMSSAARLFSGFSALTHPSILHSSPYTPKSWQDPNLLQEIYIPETQAMMKRLTGAQTVIVETVLIRNSSQNLQETPSPSTPPKPPTQGPMKLNFPQVVGFNPTLGGAIPPAPKVHLDFTPTGARSHIRHSHPTVTAACASIISAEDRLLAAKLPLETNYTSTAAGPRWALFSVWRPLSVVKRDPLAVAEVASTLPEDYVAVDVPAPMMDGEGSVTGMYQMKCFVGRAGEGHRWWYVSEQKPEEVLVVRLWDSEREGDTVGAGGVMHSSVEMEGREGEEPRESVEMRCLTIW